MISKLIVMTWTSLLVVALAVADCEAGGRHRRVACPPCSTTYCSTLPAPSPSVPPSTREPSSFVAWVNAVRSRHGLGLVTWDQAMAADAAQNSARGFGHSYMGRARRQNAGMGPLVAVQSAWLASPPHLAAILDPGITLVGLAGIGNVWTMSAR